MNRGDPCFRSCHGFKIDHSLPYYEFGPSISKITWTRFEYLFNEKNSCKSLPNRGLYINKQLLSFCGGIARHRAGYRAGGWGL